ncbi:MAG TPA: ABC transporter substrate-binding protein [Pseudolabrys sp.]|nr:ABC transporter substrate-binding protein [Pseudolabrys sp.]
MKWVAKLALPVIAAIVLTLPAAAEPVKIVNIGHGYFSGPLYVAIHEKLFQKHGLEPDVITVKGGSLAFQAVSTHQADFGVLSYEHILDAAGKGRQVVAIFNIADRPLNNVVASKELLAEAKGKNLAERVRLLKGHRVGTPSSGGSGEKMLTVLGREYGLAVPGDVKLAYLGADAAAYVGAFRSNVIDAGMPFEPAGVELEQAGLGGTLINIMSGEVPAFRDLIFMTVCTYPEMLQKNPDLARKVAAVFTEAQQILLDPKRGKEIMAAEYPKLSAESNAKAYETVSQIWSKNKGKMTLAGAKKVFDYLQPSGDKIDFEKTFSNEFLPK